MSIEFRKLKLTDRQQLCFDVINSHISDKGYPPTHVEVASLMGINSSKGAADHIRALERKGRLKISEGIPRGISIISNTPDRYESLVSSIKELIESHAVGNGYYMQIDAESIKKLIEGE